MPLASLLLQAICTILMGSIVWVLLFIPFPVTKVNITCVRREGMHKWFASRCSQPCVQALFSLLTVVAALFFFGAWTPFWFGFRFHACVFSLFVLSLRRDLNWEQLKSLFLYPRRDQGICIFYIRQAPVLCPSRLIRLPAKLIVELNYYRAVYNYLLFIIKWK